MPSNEKTSIGVSITVTGQDQLDKYTKSFNSLRNSIDGLSQPFNSLDKNLSKYTDSLKALTEQNQKISSTGSDVHDKVTEMTTSFSTGIGVLQLFGIQLKSLYVGLTGGLSIVIAFLPEIINFATALFKGKDAASAMAANFKTLNEVMKDSNREASSEVTRLKLLYTSATDVNNGYIDRIKSVRELKKEYPQHLKALSDEEILNGKAKDTYDKLTRSLIDNARAKAALNKMGSEANKMLDADFQIEKIRNANYNEKKQYEREAAAAGNGSRGVAGRYPLQYYKEQSDKRAKIAIDEQEKIKNSAQNSMEFLTRFAGGANAIAKTITADVDATPVNKSHNKTYWEAELEKQQNALDTLDATAKNFKQKAAPIIKQMRDIKKILSSYSDNETKIDVPKKSKQSKQATFTRQPELKMPAYVNIFEKDKQTYDKELALLDEQHTKKLIAEEDYIKQKAALQEKYNQLVETKVTTILFDNDTANDFRKKNQELWDEIEKDEKGTKSILPWEKHNAEKKLIDDKYAYEILQARGNTEKIKELEAKKLLDLNALNEQYEQQKKEFAINTAQQVADKAFSIIGNNIKAGSNAKIKSLEKDKTAELSNKNLTESQRKAIEDKYQKKENQEKVKAFKAEQKAQVAQAIINGALAITKATAQTGVLAPFVIPGIIASTAMQVATIVAQKPPAFARGGHFVSDGRGAVLSGYSRTDDTNAYLRSGEAVVVSEAMRNPWARNLVSAINVAHGGRDFSVPNTTRGYAIGGIFTDGGNANRYYNQPVNDAKELANTLAYQMINNFPPIYVDVKDVNNQQGILAQTVNRVNL